MSAHHPPVPGTSNLGPPTHGQGPKHNPTVSYYLQGIVRWYDTASTEPARIVVHVDATNGHAGRYLDADVTVALAAHDEVPEGLRRRARVRVHARMPRELGLDTPDPLPATSISVVG